MKTAGKMIRVLVCVLIMIVSAGLTAAQSWPNPGHPAEQVGGGTFNSSFGNFRFENEVDIVTGDPAGNDGLFEFSNISTSEALFRMDNGNNWGLLMRSDANSPKIGAYNGGNLQIYPFSSASGDLDTGKGVLMYFDFVDMEVGIGTVPDEELTVSGNISATQDVCIDGMKCMSTLLGGGGSGAVNRVAIWDSATDLTSDPDLYFNPSTNNLGVGTANPAGTLHLNKSTTPILFMSGGGGTTWKSVIVLSDQTTDWDGSVWEIGQDKNENFRITRGNHTDWDAEPFAIDANTSNVGIGTNNPEEKLDVEGEFILGTNTNKDETLGYKSVLNASWGLLYQAAGANWGHRFVDSSTGDIIQWDNDLADPVLGVIDNDGNMGIGTADPDHHLHVIDTTTTTGTTPGEQYMVNFTRTLDPSGNLVGSAGANRRSLVSEIVIPSTSTVTKRHVEGIIGSATNHGTGTIAGLWGTEGWAYNTNSATITTVSGIWTGGESDAGSVANLAGIWTNTYPSGGTITNVYGIYLGTNTNYGATITNRYALYIADSLGSATNDFAIYQNDTQKKNYFGSDVGIGTASPESKLEVMIPTSEATLDDTDYRTALFGLAQTNMNSLEFRSGRDDGSLIGRYATIQSWSNQEASARNLGLNPNGGYVGIGTTTPDNEFDVVGTAQFGYSDNSGGYLTNSWSATYGYRFLLLGSTYFDGVNFITDEGNKWGSNYVSSIGLEAGGKGIVFYTQPSTGGTQRTDAVGTFNGYERMRIDSSGNVGIGTTPQAGSKLDVAGSIYYSGNLTGYGADFAEMMPKSEHLDIGDVVCLNEDMLIERCSSHAQRSVIGVVSEQPTIIGNRGVEDGAPVGIAGIVPTKVKGPIARFDMLTTSAKPGFAERASLDDFGAIIGKAMQPCDADECTIKVLVSLV